MVGRSDGGHRDTGKHTQRKQMGTINAPTKTENQPDVSALFFQCAGSDQSNVVYV